MSSPSRRSLLAAAAAAVAASGPALAAGREGRGGEDGALVFASRAAAAAAAVPAGTELLYCGGFARAGDRGEALYVRSADEPVHAGKFRSADGAWWALSEASLNPFQFGAKGDGHGDDSAAIQAMFDYVEAAKTAFPMQFLGARYYLAKGLRLPIVPVFVTLDLDGGGAVLLTDAPITIMHRLPGDQTDAMQLIGRSHYDIHHFAFRGSGAPGQTGLHIGATFTNLVRNCTFEQLEYGSIGTFCLASAWRDNLYHYCSKRGLVLQSATGYDQGAVWPGANEPNSASNVSVIENCRVFGHRDQISSFGIFGSDAVRMTGCISEGHGANYDVHYDFQGSSTAKHFHIDMFHCEAADAKVNFKIRASGKVVIERVVRSLSAAICDAWGSVNCEIVIRGIAWLAGMPEATGRGPNPQGRWFYHSDGNGHGAASERGQSSGTAFRFEDCVEGAWRLLSDPARWEGGTLPLALHIRGLGQVAKGDEGWIDWSNAPITFASPVTFADRNSFGGIAMGAVEARTGIVPPRSSVAEDFAVPELLAAKHFVSVNPAGGDAVPPPGIAWNGYLEADGLLRIRFTNVTDQPIRLSPGARWNYCAPRRG
jgi:hypothetical protein